MQVDFIFQIAILIMSVVIHEVSHGYTASLLGRKRAIEELSGQTEEARRTENQLGVSEEAIRVRVEDTEVRLEELRTDWQAMELDVARLERDDQQLGQAINDLFRQMEVIDGESQDLNRILVQAGEDRAAMEDQLKAIEVRREELESVVSSNDDELEALLEQLHSEEAVLT